MSDDLVKQLREGALEKQQEAWDRADGGQDLSIEAGLALVAADRIEALEARAEKAEAEARDAYTQGLEDAAKVVGEKSGAARKKLARCGSEGHPEDEHVWSAIISHLDLAQSSIRARAALNREAGT